MKVLCKRTYFERVGHSIRWEKNKYYDVVLPNKLEEQTGIYYLIFDKELMGFETYSPIRRSEFDKYFIDIDQNRNDKIEQILK